jgi:ferredoxin
MDDVATAGYINIDRNLCGSCGGCVAVCPPAPPALLLHELTLTFYPDRCIECDNCVAVCPIGALSAGG